MNERHIIVVGAGLAGLCAARTIQRAGHTAVLYEASDGVGGRVRTDVVDGFLLDRGFQVLFTAYPAIRQEIDLEALRLRVFDPGAIVCWNGKRHIVADPLRAPLKGIETAFTSLFPWGDKLNIARLSLLLRGMSVRQIFDMPDQTMGEFLTTFGFTCAIIDRFFRPFFAGVFLESEMVTSARMFAFVYKMLAEGQTTIPEKGMGALPQQIADSLAPGSLYLNSPVESLIQRNGRVVGVTLRDGSRVEGDSVILATEFDVAARLAGLDIPATWRVSTDICFALPEPLYCEKLLTLFTEPGNLVNNASVVSNIAPSYAPEGQHLLSATVLGKHSLSDIALAGAVKAEIGAQYPRANTDGWRLLRVHRLHHAQFAQPAGIWDHLPDTRTPLPGLILAGEITSQSSLHGALTSGQKAAGLAMSVKE